MKQFYKILSALFIIIGNILFYNYSFAITVDVRALIPEPTCAYQTDDSGGGVANLGGFSYVAISGGNKGYYLHPEFGSSGVGSVTLIMNPNCNQNSSTIISKIEHLNPSSNPITSCDGLANSKSCIFKKINDYDVDGSFLDQTKVGPSLTLKSNPSPVDVNEYNLPLMLYYTNTMVRDNSQEELVEGKTPPHDYCTNTEIKSATYSKTAGLKINSSSATNYQKTAESRLRKVMLYKSGNIPAYCISGRAKKDGTTSNGASGKLSTSKITFTFYPPTFLPKTYWNLNPPPAGTIFTGTIMVTSSYL